MKHYARVVDGVALEVWNDGGLNLTPVDVHVPALAKQFVSCPCVTRRDLDGWRVDKSPARCD